MLVGNLKIMEGGEMAPWVVLCIAIIIVHLFISSTTPNIQFVQLKALLVSIYFTEILSKKKKMLS